MRKFLLLVTIAALCGCATLSEPPAQQVMTKTTEQISAAVCNKGCSISSVALFRYSDACLFILYLSLLIIACLYFKHTGRRLRPIEDHMRVLAPRMSPVTNILRILAKAIGFIYCKKK